MDVKVHRKNNIDRLLTFNRLDMTKNKKDRKTEVEKFHFKNKHFVNNAFDMTI